MYIYVYVRVNKSGDLGTFLTFCALSRPIIDTEHDRRTVSEAGMEGLISKPCTSARLREAVVAHVPGYVGDKQ